jgi:hypothetical protein
MLLEFLVDIKRILEKSIGNILNMYCAMSEEHWIIHYALMVTIFSCRVILMLIGKGIWMAEDLRLVIYSLWQEVLFLGVARSKVQLLFHPWKQSKLLHLKQQRKVYG